MPDFTGQSIPRYHVIEKIGVGGMATVYKAYDTRLEREVAIKFIRREAFSPEIVDRMLLRFEREAKALARLSHPNIVKVYDYGEHEGSPYLVMEYVSGGTLKARLKTRKDQGEPPVTCSQAARLVLPVARALDYAHRREVIHRDIKPANILINEDGDPMLSDFGIAKILDLQDSSTLTGTGVGIGTPEYMSPEQGLGHGVDRRTDIYALGVVFYELVTGRVPYMADTPMAVMLKQMTEPLPRPRQFVPDLPEMIEQIIFKAMAKKPDERYPDMSTFADALEKLAYNMPSARVTASETLAAPPSQAIETQVAPPAPAPQSTATLPLEPETVPLTSQSLRRTPVPSPVTSAETSPIPSSLPQISTPSTLPSAKSPSIPSSLPQPIFQIPTPAAVPVSSQPLPAQPRPAKPAARHTGLYIGIGAGALALVACIITGIALALNGNLPFLAKATPTLAVGEVNKTSTARPAATEQAPATAVPAEENPPTPLPTQPAVYTGPLPLPANPRTVTGGIIQEPDNIVPYYTMMTVSFSIAQMTLVGLAEYDLDETLLPELAAEIPSIANGGISPDGLTITWHLRPGLFWSDGVLLTSADVKFSLEQNNDPNNNSQWKDAYAAISYVETPDDLTAVVHFTEMNPSWPTLFALGPDTAGAILPEHILGGKTHLESNPFIHWPVVTSGPFVINEWAPGDHIQLLPNPNYSGSTPAVDQVIIRFIPDKQAAISALQTGEIDFFDGFSEDEIPTLTSLEPGLHTRVAFSNWWEHYIFNLGSTTPVDGHPNSATAEEGFCPLKNEEIKAIIYAIDRESIAHEILGDWPYVPATQWTNSFWTNTRLSPEPFDPAQAKAVLADAGYTSDQDGDGILEGECGGQMVELNIQFWTNQRPVRQEVAFRVQEYLRQVGINFVPNFSPSLFAAKEEGGILANEAFDMAGYTVGFFPDPYPWNGDWGCDTSLSNYNLCDPLLAEMFAAVNASPDPQVRKDALGVVQQMIYDKAYVVMMYARSISVIGYRDQLSFPDFNGFTGFFWRSEDWSIND